MPRPKSSSPILSGSKVKVSSSKSHPIRGKILHLLESIGRPFLRLFYLCWSLFKFTFTLASFLPRVFLKLSFFLGDILLNSAKTLISRLKPRPRFFVPKYSLKLLLAGFTALLIAAYILVNSTLPDPHSLKDFATPLTTKIYDRNGRLLSKIYQNQNRTLVHITDIPAHLRLATLAIEDKEFYSHPGISLRGIGRAIFENIFLGIRSGGSTITQQLVKNTLLSPQRSITRKIKEIILALKVERIFTKDQILEMYLNQIGYGGVAFGIEEASQQYFGKSVKDVTVAEGALLSGLTASPTTYSPFGAHPELARARQLEVLRLMLENKFITLADYEKARSEKIVLSLPNHELKAPHFVMYVRDFLARKYGEDMVNRGGLEVTTSLDLDIQEKAQAILENEIDSLKRLRISNGALLVTHPQTGEILAMVGSKNYFDLDNQGNFNVTTAIRQPGSSIKPIMYSVALENGYTPATLIEDSPVTFNLPGQLPYSPKNYDNRFHGKVTVRTALASSYNIPAVKVLSALGVRKMIERGKQMGITTWNDPGRFGLSLTLGGGEVKMTDLSVAYAVLANLGSRVDLNPVLRVRTSQNEILEELSCANLETQPAAPDEPSPSCPGPQVVNSGVAFQLIDILSDNSARAPAFGLHSTLVIPGKTVAVKTGTSNNLKDNWTIGFTPDFLVAVWVGNNDNSPASYVVSGVTGASSIWQKVMYQLIKDLPDRRFSPPQSLVQAIICAPIGSLYCTGCPAKKTEYFLPGTQPKIACVPGQFQTPSPTP